MKIKISNTQDLRSMLIETIQGIKDGTVDAKQGQAIANLSSKIIQSAKLDLDALKYNQGQGDDTLKAGKAVLQLVNVA